MYKVYKYNNTKIYPMFDSSDDVIKLERMIQWWYEVVRNDKNTDFIIVDETNNKLIKIVNNETKS